MPYSGPLNEQERSTFNLYVSEIEFPKGSLILQQGDTGDGVYVIDKGRVRLELDTTETNSDSTLGFLEEGMLLGEFSMLDQLPRSSNAYAETDVKVRFISTRNFKTLCEDHPKLGVTILMNFSRELAGKIRVMNERMSGFIHTDEVDPDVEEMISKAKLAYKTFIDWPEDKVDALLKEIAEAISGRAELFAKETVEETGMGIVEHKIIKIQYAAMEVYKQMTGKHTRGLAEIDPVLMTQEISTPMGVIFGLIPVTNPVSTIVFKVLISLKSRNALILSCHRNAMGVCNAAGEIIQGVLKKHGAPIHLLQWIKVRGSRKLTAMYMSHQDVALTLATGGPSMVKAAYSSGNPAIGVGMGNAPTLVCSDADPDKVAAMVISSKSFDNGIICGSDNNLVVVESLKQKFMEALLKHGAIILTPPEKTRFLAATFDAETKHIRKNKVGQDASKLAAEAGIERDGDFRLIVVQEEKTNLTSQLSNEKLAPVLSLFFVDDEAEGMKICHSIISKEGIGHTAIIHTHNADRIKAYGMAMPASRILVNTPGTMGCIGIGNGLLPSLTLGCGTFAGCSTTDNVNHYNLLNIKRIAYPVESDQSELK
jgi:acetaldehyde dehydrogenase / alcohol dehydrogenase